MGFDMGFNDSSGPNPPPGYLAAMASLYGWPEPTESKAPNSAYLQLIKKAFNMGAEMGKRSVADANAVVRYKRNLPQMLERAKQEFDKTRGRVKAFRDAVGPHLLGF